MLSPAARTAATRYAADAPVPAGLVDVVEQTFLAGHCHGFQARAALRVPIYPPAGQQQWLELLAPLLPYSTIVYQPFGGRYGLLRGLPACAAGQGEPLADVEFYADAEYREEGGGDLSEPVGKLLPCLYGFEDLASEMLLPDGRRGVPALVIGQNILGANGYHTKVVQVVIDHEEDDLLIRCLTKGGNTYISFTEEDFLGSLFKGFVEKQMRSLGFAVGLRPDQYQRRVVGHDYASGERPREAKAAVAAPATEPCPTCNGSGTNAHELPSHERFVHGSEIHECYTCEGSGQVGGKEVGRAV